MKRGFTLIELLVVIAIIGLLASIVLVSLNNARTRARDALRVQTLHTLQNALELHYDSNNFQYPDVCVASSGAFGGWSNLLSSNYIAVMPNDPTNTAGQYGYYYCSGFKPNGNCGFTDTGVATNYILATRLENPSVSPNSCPGGFSGWDNNSLNYIVGSGQ